MNNPHDMRRLAAALVADAIAAPPERILSDAMYRAVDDLEGQGPRSERIAEQLLGALVRYERATLPALVPLQPFTITYAAELASDADDPESDYDGSPDCRCETCPRGGPYTCIGGEND